jgi:hypothetical protein
MLHTIKMSDQTNTPQVNITHTYGSTPEIYS